MALGPTLGSLFIRYTEDALSVFYLAGILHLAFILLVWFVIPESTSRAQMNASATKWEETAKARLGNGVLKNVFGFFSPLAIFIPPVVKTRSPPRRKRDWNLTLLAVAYGFSGTLIVRYGQIKKGTTPFDLFLLRVHTRIRCSMPHLCLVGRQRQCVVSFPRLNFVHAATVGLLPDSHCVFQSCILDGSFAR